jgi:endonuclease YncB( thermonuclease family)
MDNKNEDLDLKLATCEIKEFSLDGKNMWGKVVYVYDGDTAEIVFKIDEKLVKFNCRLTGIDTPEIVPKNIVDEKLRNQETILAIKSRNYLISRVVNIPIEKEFINKDEVKIFCAKSSKLVWIKAYEFDKYGRLLVELYDDNNALKSFNQEMIDKKYAIKYDGRTFSKKFRDLENIAEEKVLTSPEIKKRL